MLPDNKLLFMLVRIIRTTMCSRTSKYKPLAVMLVVKHPKKKVGGAIQRFVFVSSKLGLDYDLFSPLSSGFQLSLRDLCVRRLWATMTGILLLETKCGFNAHCCEALTSGQRSTFQSKTCLNLSKLV